MFFVMNSKVLELTNITAPEDRKFEIYSQWS